MKKVKNWKIIESGLSLSEAIEIYNKQSYKDYKKPFAIKSEVSSYLISPDTEGYLNNVKLTVYESISTWNLLAIDDDREDKNNKIIELAKESNCTGWTHAKLEHMSIEDIFNGVCQTLDNDMKYKLLLYYFNNKIYKKN